jgi:aspartyl-tRNA(Asn)/glutamyl-tRNA(Gln) amidotransferase subunit A
MPISAASAIDTIEALAPRIAQGRLTSVALVESCLERIHACDDRLHSFVDVFGEEALAAARAADAEVAAGRRRGALHGIPYAIKDVFDVAGRVTSAGSAAFRSNIAARNATVVDALRAAGAILLGKLATHELTHGGVGDDLPWPAARNPWNTDHDTGGSSTGAGAAVAAGLCTFAIGSDTGGSVRAPAALCGVSGLKPTYGLVGRGGMMANAPSLDHVGVLAWSALDCGIVLDAIAGRDSRDDASLPNAGRIDALADTGKGLAGLRVGVVDARWLGSQALDPRVADALAAAQAVFARHGATLASVELPALAVYNACKLTLQRPEFFALHGERLRETPNDFGQKLKQRVVAYDTISAVDYLHARSTRRMLIDGMLEAMQDIDVLIAPATFGPAPRAADALATVALNEPDPLIPFSVTGFPALAQCIGFTGDGLPIGMQLVARPLAEATLVRAAVGYERATPWRQRRPMC